MARTLQLIEDEGHNTTRSRMYHLKTHPHTESNTDLGLSGKYPLITMGTTEIQVPLPLGTIKDIRDLCPKPQKHPTEAALFLERHCTGCRMSEEDCQIIIQAVDPDPITSSDVSTLFSESQP